MGNLDLRTQMADTSTALLGTNRVQKISQTLFSTKTLASGTVPGQTDFFVSAPNADPTIDFYDQGNALVTSFKTFSIDAISVNLRGAATANGLSDVDQLINQCVLVLTAQNKEVGRFPLRFLKANGGTFVAGAQVAAASNVGVTNGTPSNEPYAINRLTLAPNQQFKATLLAPVTTAISLSASTQVQVALIGEETRPLA